MAELAEIVQYLDRELRTAELPDYPQAENGLQVTNDGKVTKVASAVDASLAVIEDAVAHGADLLVVHHGLFWQGVQRLTGPFYKKMKLALENNLAIYSSHLPLDVHLEWGNNALLLQELGLESDGTFHEWKGIQLGLTVDCGLSFGELRHRAEKLLGRCVVTGDATEKVGQLGIITGGAGSEVEKVAAEGIETFFSGEGPHWSFPLADELGLRVLLGGHYATETFGVRKVASILAERYGLGNLTLDHPTGL